MTLKLIQRARRAILATTAVAAAGFIFLFADYSMQEFLALRNKHINKVRNEPIIKDYQELTNLVEQVKTDLGLNVPIKAGFYPTLTNALGDTYGQGKSFCYRLDDNSYGIILGGFGRTRWGVEHEVFHIKEMTQGKLSNRKLSQYLGEIRAQDYCLRNYKNGKLVNTNLNTDIK